MNINESNVLFALNANFDLSSNTQLDITFTDPNGLEISITPSRISAPATSGVFNFKGIDTTYAANEYMLFVVLVTDFTIKGEWAVCGLYTNTTTTPDQIHYVTKRYFSVGDDC